MKSQKEQLQQSLIRISAGLSALSGSLPEPDRGKCKEMVSLLDRKLIPQLAADCPLLVAVTGGGSTGKSTIFNLLAGKKASAADPRAGFTRRMVAAIHPNVAADSRKMELLFERFRANAHPRRLENADEALSPGDPVYVECPDIPEHLVYVDTPDFDTGTREKFTNRDAAKEILDVADVILYVATNATYNNKSATDFVRSVLSEVGLRKVALLYRFSPVYSDDMVCEHMAVALSNLYPDEATARGACIGIWRIDESNEVAAGICEPEIKPLSGGALVKALSALDPTKTRAGVMRSEIAACLDNAQKWYADAKVEKLKFAAYRDSLKYLTSKTSLACLETAPQRDILRLFVKEWEAAQPWLVRNGRGLSRGTVEWVHTALKRVKAKVARKQPACPQSPDFASEFHKCFLEKADILRNKLAAPPLKFKIEKPPKSLLPLVQSLSSLAETDSCSYCLVDCGSGCLQAVVARPKALSCGGDGGKVARSGDMLRQMADRASEIMGEMQSIRPAVRALVRDIRNKMSRWQRCGEWVSASLDSVAIAGALTFIIFNPHAAVVAGAPASTALLSLFGLNDLVAVPALGAFVAAHSKIDRTLVDSKMKELFTKWASEKATALQSILEESISGGEIAACDKQCKRLDEAFRGLEAALAAARNQAKGVFSDDKETVRQGN